jgi:UDP-N-acetyl-D-mannosaminuronate dehydrogenase
MDSVFAQGNNKSLIYKLMQFNKVLVVGLGQLGLSVTKYVKQRGFDIYGYDINPKAVEIAEKTAAIKKAVNFSDFDVFILCVSTHKPDDMFSPQIDGEANKKDDALVSIESTFQKEHQRKYLNYSITDSMLFTLHIDGML